MPNDILRARIERILKPIENLMANYLSMCVGHPEDNLDDLLFSCQDAPDPAVRSSAKLFDHYREKLREGMESPQWGIKALLRATQDLSKSVSQSVKPSRRNKVFWIEEADLQLRLVGLGRAENPLSIFLEEVPITHPSFDLLIDRANYELYLFFAAGNEQAKNLPTLPADQPVGQESHQAEATPVPTRLKWLSTETAFAELFVKLREKGFIDGNSDSEVLRKAACFFDNVNPREKTLKQAIKNTEIRKAESPFANIGDPPKPKPRRNTPRRPAEK